MKQRSTMESGEVLCTLKECLSSIMSGTVDEAAEGWQKLNNIEDTVQNSLQVRHLEEILKEVLQRHRDNLYEIPRLMVWFAKYLNDEVSTIDPISNYVAIFIRNSDIQDISLLASIVEVMLEYEVYLPSSAHHIKICEAIIMCLASLRIAPSAKHVSEFNDKSAKIQNFLMTVCEKGETTMYKDLICTCLKMLCSIMSDSERKKEAGLALVRITVFQIFKPPLIPYAVDWILKELNNDQERAQALRMLCFWASQYPAGNQFCLWILAFIRILERQRKFSVLIKATEAMLERLFNTLVLPLARQSLGEIIVHMLKSQNTPKLFHKLIGKIQNLLSYLAKSESKTDKEFVQTMVDVTRALTMRFPGYRIYDALENSFPVAPQMHMVYKILNGPVWHEESDDSELQITYRSNCGKVGLSNLGNTCYMNSVLQALVMTKQFCHEVLSYKFSADPGEEIVLRKLQNLFALLLYSKRISLAPNDILLASRPANFMPGQQQDSSEFLCHLLDVLYEQKKSASMNSNAGDPVMSFKAKKDQTVDPSISDTGSGSMINRWTTEEDLTEGVVLQRKTQSLADFTQGDELTSTQQLGDSNSDSTDSGIQSVGEDKASTQSFLVHRVFGGESMVTYQCAQCNTSSHNTDQFRDLQLCFPEEIPENQEVSVQDLINYYLTPERLTGDNKYRCDRCATLCDAQRIIKVLQAPSHLILTLKHFHYDLESRLRTKLRHKVMYNETIQLPVYGAASVANETFKLYAAVVHSGYSMDYGHYFTYACDSKYNWYKFNDSYVSNNTLEDFKSLEPPDTPYILFYEKVECVGGIDEEDKPDLLSLSKHIQQLVASDVSTHNEELRNQKKRTESYQYATPLLKRYDNSDDENPPPSNCRSAVDIPINRFLF